MSDTGKLFRDPILAAGFYWYDAPQAQTAGFQQWLSQNVQLVKVRKSTTFPDHLWVLFEVTSPVLWLDAKQFGFPNVANETDSFDVVSSGAEPQKDVLDQVADAVKDFPLISKLTPALLIAGVIAVGLYLLPSGVASYAKRRIGKRGSPRSGGNQG